MGERSIDEKMIGKWVDETLKDDPAAKYMEGEEKPQFRRTPANIEDSIEARNDARAAVEEVFSDNSAAKYMEGEPKKPSTELAKIEMNVGDVKLYLDYVYTLAMERFTNANSSEDRKSAQMDARRFVSVLATLNNEPLMDSFTIANYQKDLEAQIHRMRFEWTRDGKKVGLGAKLDLLTQLNDFLSEVKTADLTSKEFYDWKKLHKE